MLPLLLLLAAASGQTGPVFRVDAKYPTQDKPQSKLWFARGTWWAWLPDGSGSGIWKRTPRGWLRQTALDQALRGLPGRADVWADEDTATAVLVDAGRLAVVRLRWNGPAGYVAAGRASVFEHAGLETATIARDRTRWWIGYGWREKMWARASTDLEATHWFNAVEVSRQNASPDDICAIVALPGGVGLLWSDQVHDAIYFRRHSGGSSVEAWNEPEIVAAGGKTADDHIRAAVSEDGTLYVATKNSVDAVGKAQLVLRIRTPAGRWTNRPYALRTAVQEPSRPIVLLGGARHILLHTIYRRGVEAALPSFIAHANSTPLLTAGTPLNDVTGAKARLPEGEPWVVLASDARGNVYEGLVRP